MSIMIELKNKWVLITGASSGFGAAAALKFAKLNSNLILGARRLDRLKNVAKQAMDTGAPEAFAFYLDVSSTTSVNEFVINLKDKTDRIDVLINNAGGAHGLDPIKEGIDSDWENMIQSNVLGLLRMTRAILPFMPHNAGATIINVGSVAGHTAYEGGAVYCGCKAAVRQISKALRLELCGTGIRVCELDPGMAETEFSIVRFKGDIARAQKVYEGVQPLTADDIAETMVWIATRPNHVCIDEILIKPTDQAEIYKVYRRMNQK
jgi:NADP-dependent 3-hydroxy acid dehydrogenase YdfG